MDAIVSRIGDVPTVQGAITQASSVQETSIVQVNQAIADMDQVTQHNAALVEQAAAAADALQEQAAQLALSMDFFQIDDGAPAPARHRLTKH